MNEGPLVSVVISTYKRPRMLHGALRSILRQSYTNLEVVVVDDGGDPPVKLSADLAEDPRIDLLRLDENRGTSRAVNLGVRRCTGELLAFLDDDDEWFPSKIERQVQVLAGSGPGVAGVDCGYEMWHRARLHYRCVPQPDRDLPRMLLARAHVPPTTILLRRRIFDEMGGYAPVMAAHHDWELWLRITDRYRIEPLPEVLARRRSHRAVPPGPALRDYRNLLSAIEPRLAALEPSERSRIRAVHDVYVGTLLAASGERRAARVALLRARRRDPRALQPWLQLARTLVGEGVWRVASALVRSVGHSVARVAGYEPRLIRS